MLVWMSCLTLKNKVRNDYIRENLKIALVYDKLKETHLRQFGHVSRRPKTAHVRRVENLQVAGTRRKGRPLKTWREGVKERYG